MPFDTSRHTSAPETEASKLEMLGNDSFSHIPHAFTRTMVAMGISANAKVLMNLIIGSTWGHRHEHGELSIRRSRTWYLEQTGLSRRQYQSAALELERARLITRTRTRHPFNPHQQGWTRITVILSDELISHTRKRRPAEPEPTPSAQSIHASQTPGEPVKPVGQNPVNQNQPAPEPPKRSSSNGAQTDASSADSTQEAAEKEAVAELTPAELEKAIRRDSSSASVWLISSPSVRKAVVAAYQTWTEKQRAGQEVNRAALLKRHIEDAMQTGTDAGGNARDAATYFDHALRIPPKTPGASGKPLPQSGTTASEAPWVTLPAEIVQTIKQRVARAIRLNPFAGRVDQLTREIAWSLAVGCFAGSEQPAAKSINAACKMIRQQRWQTPHGYASTAVKEINNAGWAFTVAG